MEYGKIAYWILQVTEACLWYCLLFPEMTDRRTKRGERARLWTATLMWGGLYGYRGLWISVDLGYAKWGFLSACFFLAVFSGKDFLTGALWAFVSCNTASLLKLAALLARGLLVNEKMLEVMYESPVWLSCLVELCLISLLFAGNKRIKTKRIRMDDFLRRGWPFLLTGGILEHILLEYIIVAQKNHPIFPSLLMLNVCAIVAAVIGLAAMALWYLNIQAKEGNRVTLMRNSLVSQEYAALKEEYEKFARLAHEMNRERQYLYQCLRNGQYAKALAYLEEKGQIPEPKGQVWTGNGFLDYLISTRKQKMDKEGTTFFFYGEFTEIPIAEEDFLTLLGNLLDNAQEAAALCEPGRRWVRLEFGSINDMFQLRVENASSRLPIVKNGRFSSTKPGFGHGWGTENIRSIVEKYGGILRQAYTEQDFQTEIVFVEENKKRQQYGLVP